MSTETIEANKLIAEFMGGKIEKLTERHGEPMGVIFGERIDFLECHRLIDLKYHSSWEWLMPVVEKIWKAGKMVSINFYTDAGTVNSKIYNWEFGAPYQEAESTSAIQSVYVAVIEFIKFYNEVNQPK